MRKSFEHIQLDYQSKKVKLSHQAYHSGTPILKGPYSTMYLVDPGLSDNMLVLVLQRLQ